MSQDYFYLLTQDKDNKPNIARMEGVRTYQTAFNKAFNTAPLGTKTFMVLSENDANLLADCIKQVTRHLIGEK